MSRKTQTKLVHVGEYVAQVEVELIDEPEGWSPYLSLQDATKLDAVRQALARGDIQAASKLGQVFKLMPIAA